MQYKVLALDLDGTLTNTEKVITPRTKAALQEAARRGVCIVLASGRPTVGIEPLARELELQKYGGCILSYNGGKLSVKPVSFSTPSGALPLSNSFISRWTVLWFRRKLRL